MNASQPGAPKTAFPPSKWGGVALDRMDFACCTLFVMQSIIIVAIFVGIAEWY